MTFDPNWPHGHTISGNAVKIVYTSDEVGFRHLAVVVVGGKDKSTWISDSGHTIGGERVENAPAPKRRIEYWVVAWSEGGASAFRTEEDAKGAIKSIRRSNGDAVIALKHITIEEGEGL